MYLLVHLVKRRFRCDTKTPGHHGLRRALTTKLACVAVQAAPEQIVATMCATHAFDILSRTLLRAGE